MQGMLASSGSCKRDLNRSMRAQCLGLVVQQLAYKAEGAGRKLVKVGPRPTTQRCSTCGGLPPDRIALGARVNRCAHCSYEADRAINAARNIG